MSPALQVDSLPSEPPRKLKHVNSNLSGWGVRTLCVKMGPKTSSISITWKLVRIADSWALFCLLHKICLLIITLEDLFAH